jgi:hypothetical protein
LCKDPAKAAFPTIHRLVSLDTMLIDMLASSIAYVDVSVRDVRPEKSNATTLRWPDIHRNMP